MTPVAVTFLLVSAAVIWGGLVASVLRLRVDDRRSADSADDD